ncbi:MAG TPA: MMPL family transporter, partial [Planctomycetaceae bacterium]|nr:MMPL family transporter [Planctomycetaceae bacterium]
KNVPPPKPVDRPVRERVESEFQITRSDCLLIVHTPELFTPRVMEAVRQMVRDVKALDTVDSLIWVESVPVMNLFGLPDPLIPPDGSSAERLALARTRALEHPLVAGQLLSDDGTALQMPIRYDWLFMTQEESGAPEIVKTARASLERSLGTDASKVELRMTGRIPLWKAERNAFSTDHRKYQIIAYAIILVLAIVLFRGVVPVLTVAGASALSVFWSFGLLKFFGRDINDMTNIVMPVLIALVSFTDGVHLMIHIRRARTAGVPPIEAAASSIRHVGLPCFLTSFTTAIGFASLWTAQSKYIQDFGLDCAFGVSVAFFAVVLTIPLLSSTWLGWKLASRSGGDIISIGVDWLAPVIDWIIAHGRFVTLTGVLLTAGLCVVSAELRPDEKLEFMMPTGTPAYRDLVWCDEAFGGIEFAHVAIQWNEAQDAAPGETLRVIQKVKQLVEAEPLLHHPLAIADLLDTFPTDRSDPETLMSFASLLPPQLRNLLYDPDQRQANVLMRCQDRGIRMYAPVFKRLKEQLADVSAENPNFTLTLQGSAVWRAEHLYQVVVDLANSLGSAAIIIFITLGLVYRSWQLGWIAIIPNVFPLAVTGAALVWWGYALNIAAVCAFTVCLGIAVDDTIHFMSRFRDEIKGSTDVHGAVRRSFTVVGAGMMTTTIVLVSGFSTVLASQMPPHRVFAGMAVMTIGSALIGDLVLLPAMLVSCYFPKKIEAESTDQEPSAAIESMSPAPLSELAPPIVGVE